MTLVLSPIVVGEGGACALLVSSVFFLYIILLLLYYICSSILYIYILLLYYIYIYIHISHICIYNRIHFGSRNSLQDCMLSWLIRWYAIYSCCRGPMLFDGLAWSFHCLVLLLLCFYATPSCWCTRMISGHALLVSVSISQWWQLSMKLFFRFYSVPFLLLCNVYARRDWMPSYPCERVYAL